MRIAILGAGAIGGVLAARLATAGHAVAVLARGPHGEALRRGGIALATPQGEIRARVSALASAAALAEPDVVFLCVKAADLAAIAAALPEAVRRAALIVPVLNGIPFWYRPDTLAAPLRFADPGGRLACLFAGTRLVGGVAHFAAEVMAPGRVRQTSGGRLVLGPVGRALAGRGPTGATADDCARIVAALNAAGVEAEMTSDIACAMWTKLVGNAAFNPVSALTGATMAQICEDETLLGIIRIVMAEVMTVARHHGVMVPVSIDQRIAMARRIGGSKLSMLQDLERGRPIEADTLLGAVAELGDRAGVATPIVDMLRALVVMRASRNLAGRAA
ncbi:MAG: 2-dehydropantoate 2-reductase [Rhodovulum sp.]|nr:2-dehydropantoate 2-reductase [Rhodovulum sp.]